MITLMGSSYGGLAGDPNIEALQRALVNLAQASGRPAINPGQVTGMMNDATVASVAAALGILTEEMPGWLYLAFQAAFIAGSTTSKAKSIVTQYATQLTIAANTAATKLHPASSSNQWRDARGGLDTLVMGTNYSAQSPQSPFTSSSIANLFAPGWYKTPFGIAFLALLAFGTYKFFIAAPKTA